MSIAEGKGAIRGRLRLLGDHCGEALERVFVMLSVEGKRGKGKVIGELTRPDR
jgi:hypothetical protein